MARWAVAILAATGLTGQQPTIRTQVPLVLVPATVTDAKGNYVDGLGLSDFVLSDEGKPQRIQLDTSDTVLVPIDLVIAVQSSDIAAAMLAKLNRVGSMIQPLVLGERGHAAVVAFDNKVRLVQEFTSDPDLITAALGQIQPGAHKSGRMIDAVEDSVEMLRTQSSNRRRVLLLVSESRDRKSKTVLLDALRAAQREGVAIYTATYSPYATPFTTKPQDLPVPPAENANTNLLAIFTELGRLGNPNVADILARGTGGEHLSFLTLKSLEQVVLHFGEELHNQYLLSFTPEASSVSEWHHLLVKTPTHPAAIVRARPGYWSVPSQQQ